jgi:hypothetical protein
MALDRSAYKDREFIAVIGDEVRPGQSGFPPQVHTTALMLMTTMTGLSDWHSARRRWSK